MIAHLLNFDKLIGTKLIKVLYYLGLLGIALAFLAQIFAAFGAFRLSFAAGVGGIIGAFVVTAIGIVFWRFMCEIYLLFFRMSDDLRDIKNHQLGLEANTTNVDSELT